MPGQRLMCVWETASVMSPSRDKGSPEASVLKALTSSSMHSSSFVKFNSTLFDEVLSKDVTFDKFKTYVRDCVHDKLTPFSHTEDHMESHCWQQCKSHYKLDELKIEEKSAKKLWQIFIRLTETGSYPPVVAKEDVVWFTNPMFSSLNLNKTDTISNTADTTMLNYRFPDFLKFIRENFVLKYKPTEVRRAVEELHCWLVQEVSMAGWLYKRTKKQANWTNWQERWFILTPGKLTYYDGPKCEIKKGEVAVTSRSELEELPPYRGVLGRKMQYRFRVRNKPYIDLEMNAASEADRKSWMTAIQETIDICKYGTTQIQMLLEKRKRLSTISKVDDSEQKLNEIKLKSLCSKAQSVKRISRGWYEDDITKREHVPHSPLQLVPSSAKELQSEEESSMKNVREKIRAIFNKCDANGNGYIDSEEFQTFLQEFGGLELDQDELKEIFDTIDRDSSDSLTFDEFYSYFITFILRSSHETTFVENKLRTEFLKADREGRSTLNFQEFLEFAQEKKRNIDRDMLFEAFHEMVNEEDGEVPIAELQRLISVTEDDPSLPTNAVPSTENKKGTLERRLRSMYNKSELQNMAGFIRDRWTRFASFKRYGASGNLVMQGASGMVADVLPGQYNLVDLACFSDEEAIQPKRVVIRGLKWVKSPDPGRSGMLIFPSDYDGSIPVDIATTEHARYYGCSLADNTQVKISLLYRHGIQDFTYQNDYLVDYVKSKNGPGLEKHEFSHLDCPLEDDSGYFILGKMVQGSSGEELHLTAFIVPTRHTLYVPGGTIHSNDYLKGTWRTMLSDEAEIDHYNIVKYMNNDDKCEPLPFTLKMTGRWSKFGSPADDIYNVIIKKL